MQNKIIKKLELSLPKEKQKKSVYVHIVLVLRHALIIYAYDLSLMDVEFIKTFEIQ